MNLFGAWMVVLIAESTGVGYGMGQVIMLARNTFNPSLVFFTIALIGVLGFLFDWLLRQAQRRHPLLGADTGGGAAWPLSRASRSRPQRRGLPRRRQDLGAGHAARARGAARRSTSTSRRASSSSCSARRAAARARCCT